MDVGQTGLREALGESVLSLLFPELPISQHLFMLLGPLFLTSYLLSLDSLGCFIKGPRGY